MNPPRRGIRRLPVVGEPLDRLLEESFHRRLSGKQLGALSDFDRSIVERSLPHTMTSVPRLEAVIDAVRYCVARELPGAFAECGVWRGGSVLAMILTLQKLARVDRHIYLYDTFEGMTKPGEHDVALPRDPRTDHYAGDELFGVAFGPFSQGRVREILEATGYPPERLHLVRGAVEDTLPDEAPPELALLRLDTDWYDSTLHELEHLYPRLCDGGVLVLDDYGHWEGARRAVDEYFARNGSPLLLNRTDYTGRTAVKH